MLHLDRRKRARLQLLEQEDDVESTDEVARSPPRGFVCPLTMDVMFDPVLDAEGNTYERSALFKWLQHNPTSPVSRQPLHERMVVTNNALRETIHEFMGTAWVQRKTAERENEPHSTRSAGHNPSPLRAKIGCFLQNTCSELGGLDLKLNSQGCCAFRYDNITIVLDVPEQVGVFCLYTKDLIQGAVLDNGELYRRAMELNFLQGDTRGGCLSVRKHSGRKEIMFSYTDRVPEVSARDFSNILLNFVETSVTLRDKLMHGMEPIQWWEDEDEEVDVTDGACDKTNGAQQQVAEQMA